VSSPFIADLLAARIPVIMEIKRTDGNGTDLVGHRPLADIVAAYEKAGAPCLSVVTGRWFGGSHAMLRKVAGLTRLPVLRKDVITAEEHVADAKSLGASAVLLTARVLPRSTLRRLIIATLRHGLTPFVEAAGERDLEAVVHGDECVVAINNKDIRRRERGGADLRRSFSLLEAALATGTRCPVSASGVGDTETGARLLAAGFRGLLVGTAVLLAADVSDWAEDLGRRRAALEAIV
jgi:indole-3-glycerol phosphate synthase